MSITKTLMDIIKALMGNTRALIGINRHWYTQFQRFTSHNIYQIV